MNQELFECAECKLHYSEQAVAKQCEAWCKQNNSCNLEITQYSEEAKKVEMKDKSSNGS